MKKVNWGASGQKVPAIAVGCMRMKEVTLEQAARLVDTAMEKGVNFLTMRISTAAGSVKRYLPGR